MTLPQVRAAGVAELDADNLRALMEDMGREPGWYTSAELHTWYASMARADGLEPPSQKAFGRALRELGYQSAIRRVDGKHARCWRIVRRAWRAQGPRTP